MASYFEFKIKSLFLIKLLAFINIDFNLYLNEIVNRNVFIHLISLWSRLLQSLKNDNSDILTPK